MAAGALGGLRGSRVDGPSRTAIRTLAAGTYMDIGYKENATKVIEKVLRSIHNQEYKGTTRNTNIYR